MNKSGFTLIELLIATFIASILGVLLFSALYQVKRFVPVVDNTTATYERAALINSQFERDLSGITVPNEFYYRQPESEKKAKQQQEAEKKKGEADKKEKETRASEQSQNGQNLNEKKPKKPLERVFYSTNKDGMFNQLSFITTNPLQVYWTAKSGSAKPRIARVLYTLREEKGVPKSYSLIRKESPNLEFDTIAKSGKESVQEYIIAEGIKSLTVEYTYFVPEVKPSLGQEAWQGSAAPAGQSLEKTKKETSKEPKKKEIKKTAEWVPQETTREPQNEANQLPLVPQLIELKIALWDEQKKRSTPFDFKIRVQSDIPEKRDAEDVTQKLLGTLREFFTQNFTPPTPTRVTHRNQFNLPKGSIRR